MERPDIQTQVDQLRGRIEDLRAKVDQSLSSLQDIRGMLTQRQMEAHSRAEDLRGRVRQVSEQVRRPGVGPGLLLVASLVAIGATLLAFALFTPTGSRGAACDLGQRFSRTISRQG